VDFLTINTILHQRITSVRMYLRIYILKYMLKWTIHKILHL